jgi:hypothetical protein
MVGGGFTANTRSRLPWFGMGADQRMHESSLSRLRHPRQAQAVSLSVGFPGDHCARSSDLGGEHLTVAGNRGRRQPRARGLVMS